MQQTDIIEEDISTPTFEDGAKLSAEQKLQL